MFPSTEGAADKDQTEISMLPALVLDGWRATELLERALTSNGGF